MKIIDMLHLCTFTLRGHLPTAILCRVYLIYDGQFSSHFQLVLRISCVVQIIHSQRTILPYNVSSASYDRTVGARFSTMWVIVRRNSPVCAIRRPKELL